MFWLKNSSATDEGLLAGAGETCFVMNAGQPGLFA
jgi:hypothetical protein